MNEKFREENKNNTKEVALHRDSNRLPRNWGCNLSTHFLTQQSDLLSHTKGCFGVMRDAWLVSDGMKSLGFAFQSNGKEPRTPVVMAGGSAVCQEPVSWSGVQWRCWLNQAHREAEVESKISSNETHPQESQSRQIMHPLPTAFQHLALLSLRSGQRANQSKWGLQRGCLCPILEVIRVNLIRL